MTRDQWLRRCAQRFIDRAGLDTGEAAACAEECARTQLDENGRNPAKWERPERAADEEMTCWEE